MKKKIIICSHAMEIGGAERSLLDMLGCFDYDKFDVDLFLYRHSGEWIDNIPAQVNLLPEIPQYASLVVPMIDLVKNLQLKILFGRLKGKKSANKFNSENKLNNSYVAIEYSHKFTCKYMPQIQPDKQYDLAISFLTPHYFVAKKVNAKKKIAWIHTDYSTVNINIDSELNMWDQYDYIASISDSCTKSFLEKFPSLENKIVLIENVLSSQMITQRANENIANDMPYENNVIRFLSIGRYTNQKNFDNVPFICKEIREKGINVKWHIIGYGADEELIKQRISQAGMEDYVILLGKKENPYPYIKNCDVYVQPSRYEGKSVAVREAQMLNKPVIITNYATASSQLTDGYDGIIVPMENEACASAIADVLSNPKLLQTIAENTKKEDYSNSSELNKLYKLIP